MGIEVTRGYARLANDQLTIGANRSTERDGRA